MPTTSCLKEASYFLLLLCELLFCIVTC
jgi:hypothetical protein